VFYNIIVILIKYCAFVAVGQWLRYCAANQKVTGSIPDGVIDINPSHRTMALGSTQPLNRNKYQENFLGINAAGA
jgi:hypothetical protein